MMMLILITIMTMINLCVLRAFYVLLHILAYLCSDINALSMILKLGLQVNNYLHYVYILKLQILAIY